MNDDRERLIRVELQVNDDAWSSSVAFDATCWSASSILQAYASKYRDESGRINAGGAAWAGIWGSSDCLTFLHHLIAEDVDAWL